MRHLTLFGHLHNKKIIVVNTIDAIKYNRQAIKVYSMCTSILHLNSILHCPDTFYARFKIFSLAYEVKMATFSYYYDSFTWPFSVS